MKLFLILGLIAVISASAVSAQHSNERPRSDESSENDQLNKVPPNKVKFVAARASADPNYFLDPNFQVDVVEVNSTYAGCSTNYTVIKGFPMDTIYSELVYRAKKGSHNYKRIMDINLEFCKDFNNKYFGYLPDAVAEVVKKGKCLPKGLHYESLDTGHFRFYDLLSVEELKDAKFKVYLTLKHKNQNLLSIELEFVSNY